MIDIVRMLLGEDMSHGPNAASTAPVFSDPNMAGLPDQVRPRIEQINELIKRILAKAKSDPMAIPTTIEVERTRDVHLPRMLESYVRIDPHHRAQVYARTGRSASYHLDDALCTIKRRLEELDTELARGDIDEFDQNRRFIEQNYGGEKPW